MRHSVVGMQRLVRAGLTRQPTWPAVFCWATPSRTVSSSLSRYNLSGFNSNTLAINELHPTPGKFKKKKRVGRGVGSGLGKTSGHGHQFSRSTPRGFEGGQKPLHKLLPKFGFTNHNKREYVTVNLDKLQHFITLGRIVPKQNNFVTIRDLLVSGIITNVSDGIKILANGKEEFKTPIHLEVSMASEEAIKTVEAAGGTITCSYFNPLALRAVTKPYKFFILPRRARPPPKLMPYYLDKSKCGYLSPEIQTRNLKLFGTVTSEELYRAEHTKWMDSQREVWKKQRESLVEKGRKKNGSASV